MVTTSIVVIGKKMSQSEMDLMYRILFENSNESPTSAIYEVYDTVTELVGDITKLEMNTTTIH